MSKGKIIRSFFIFSLLRYLVELSCEWRANKKRLISSNHLAPIVSGSELLCRVRHFTWWNDTRGNRSHTIRYKIPRGTIDGTLHLDRV